MNHISQNQRQSKRSAVRTRFTPTFYHHNIFGAQDNHEEANLVRDTPTFQSTVFNCDGYLIQTHHSRTLKSKEEHQRNQKPCLYKNQSRERKQAFLNPCCDYLPSGTYRTSRVNDQKDRLTDDINHLGGRTSRMRKCVEMMSNPIFGGYSWTPFLTDRQSEGQEKAYNPDQYRIVRSIDAKQPFKQGQDHNNENHFYDEPKIPNGNAQQQAHPVAKKKEPSYPNPNPKPNPKHANNLKKFKSASNLHKHAHRK